MVEEAAAWRGWPQVISCSRPIILGHNGDDRRGGRIELDSSCWRVGVASGAELDRPGGPGAGMVLGCQPAVDELVGLPRAIVTRWDPDLTEGPREPCQPAFTRGCTDHVRTIPHMTSAAKFRLSDAIVLVAATAVGWPCSGRITRRWDHCGWAGTFGLQRRLSDGSRACGLPGAGISGRDGVDARDPRVEAASPRARWAD